MNEDYFDIDFEIFNDYLAKTKYVDWKSDVNYSKEALEECIDLNQPLFWGSREYGEKLIKTLELFGGRNVYKLSGTDFNFIYGITFSSKIICFNPKTKNISSARYMLIGDFLNLGI